MYILCKRFVFINEPAHPNEFTELFRLGLDVHFITPLIPRLLKEIQFCICVYNII